MVNVADIAITALDTIKAYAMDGTPRFIMDELTDTTIANTQDTQDITGKGGRLLNRLKRNKAVTISGTNGLISAGMLEAQTGSKFEHSATTPVEWVEYLTVSSNSATMAFAAVGTAGSEIKALYTRNPNGTVKDELEQAASASSGKFAYANKVLTFSNITDGTEIVVFYTRNVDGHQIKNMSDSYSEKMTLVVDGTGEDTCGNIFHIQFYIPKADFNGNFDIQLGGDQAVHNFEANSMSAGNCGMAASGALWTYTVFGDEAAD